MSKLPANALDDLKASARGQVLGPEDAGYDDARKIWNAMIDRRPAVIFRCAGAADVRRAVGGGLENAMRHFLPEALIAEAVKVHVAPLPTHGADQLRNFALPTGLAVTETLAPSVMSTVQPLQIAPLPWRETVPPPNPMTRNFNV